VSYNKPDDILKWIASSGCSDTVQNTSDIDGRVRRVTFCLGKTSRDNFLRAMKRQLKLQAATRRAAPLKLKGL
jgi:hypothetical protein